MDSESWQQGVQLQQDGFGMPGVSFGSSGGASESPHGCHIEVTRLLG